MGSIFGCRPGRGVLGWVMAALAGVVPVGCSAGGSAATPPPAARLHVVVGLFPLAEVARQVGGNRVALTDLTPAGTEPRHLAVGADQVAAIGRADVVIDVGMGFQPAVEAAAPGGPATVSVLAATGGSDPYVWLDPVLMQQVVAAVAGAFERADPAGSSRYRQGARAFTAALGSLDISFRSSLADCARHDIVTAYPMFGRLAARYGLTDHAVAALPPDGTAGPGQLADLARLIRAKGLATVFDDPLAPLPAARSLARQTNVKAATLDPITGLAAAGKVGHATYQSLMADDLDKLRSALVCAASD